MRESNSALAWQSKAVLLLVVPWTAISVLVQGYWWATHAPVVALETLGISTIFGLVVWRLRAATPAGAATGAAITASLMFSTVQYPYEWSWLHGGLMPLLAVFLLTFVATEIGRARKERLGTAESRRGRNAAQVAANLGIAAIFASLGSIVSEKGAAGISALWAIAALAEAAADTVSSEIGQVSGGQPRMITTLQKVEPGTDGGVSLAGTATGVLAAIIVAAIGGWAMHAERSLFGSWVLTAMMAAGGIFGLLFDSLLGATIERRGWLNNDAVNFLSTWAAAFFALGTTAYLISIIVV